MSEKFEYAGRDLEAMAFAERYHRWILDVLRPYVGRRVVEVGAGTGSFSELLAGLRPDSLTLVEPSAAMHARLAARTWDGVEVHTRRAFFSEVAAEIGRDAQPDTLVYVNVLEHVEDDGAELRMARDALVPGGHVLIFVPALMLLHSAFDRQLGHFRRYGRRQLVGRCEEAGLRVVHARWFDVGGVLPWLVLYRLLGSTSMSPRGVRLYDRLAVPVLRRLESRVAPPVGKNLIVVARRP